MGTAPTGSDLKQSTWTPRRVALLALELAVTLLGVLVLAYLVGMWRAPDLSGKLAPEFALKTVDGRIVRLSDLRGRPVLLNFWATWCGPCRFEIPSFSRLADSRDDLEVYGIAQDQDPELLKAAIADLGITYPVLIADKATLQAYGISTFPTTVLVDAEGRVQNAHVGILLDPQLWWVTR